MFYSFHEIQSNEKVLDQFVLYNDLGYSDLRECLERAAYGKQMDPLIQSTNVSRASVIMLFGVTEPNVVDDFGLALTGYES